jgi:hypothetical protein
MRTNAVVFLIAVAAAAADLNGDGWPDIVCVNYGGGAGNVHVFINSGGSAPTFSSSVLTGSGSTYSGPVSVALADLTGDNASDIVIGDASGRVAWHKNTGAGSFSSPRVIDTASVWARAVGVADLDGDGDIDVSVWMCNVTNPLSPTVLLLLLLLHPHSFLHELFSLFRFLPPFLTSWLPGLTHSFTQSVTRVLLVTRVQILSTSEINGQLRWFTNSGGSTPSFTVAVLTSSVSNAYNMAVGDLNGDSNVDVAIAGCDHALLDCVSAASASLTVTLATPCYHTCHLSCVWAVSALIRCISP